MVSDLKGSNILTKPDEAQNLRPSKKPHTEVWKTCTQILEEAGTHIMEDTSEKLDRYISEQLHLDEKLVMCGGLMTANSSHIRRNLLSNA